MPGPRSLYDLEDTKLALADPLGTLPDVPSYQSVASPLGGTSSIPNSTLCSTCTAIVQRPNAWQNPTREDAPFRTLDISDSRFWWSTDEEACPLCHLSWSAFRLENPPDQWEIVPRPVHYQFFRYSQGDTTSHLLSEYNSEMGIDCCGLRFESLDVEYKFHASCELYLAPAEEYSGTVETKEHATIPATTDHSASSWSLVREWIQMCKSHALCNRLRDQDKWLPTRLLDIFDASSEHCTLITAKGLPANSEYITLSYRWGDTPFNDFIKQCSESWFERIKIADLPQTFQDAIAVVRQLGFRYVWIDAFCIKQGSEDDWIKESARMGNVYRFSSFNIAASRITNVDESIFASRDPLDVAPCMVQMGWDLDKRWIAYQRNLWDENVGSGPLLERGWVVQEIVLAPGVLHFGQFQLAWECAEMRACETFPTGMPNSAVSRKLNVHSSSAQFDLTRMAHPQQWHLVLWSRVVERFSVCELSHTTKDKLVALSGLAKTFALPKNYLAGLWRQDLAYQLLWRAPGLAKRAPASGEEYQAPSWSWASINGQATYRVREAVNDPAAELLVSIEDACVELRDLDPTGRVKAGRIKIAAPLARMDAKRLFLEQAPHGRAYRPRESDFWQSIPDDVDDEPDVDELYCMPVELKTRRGEGELLIVGLILCPSAVHKDSFRRYGYFTMQGIIGEGEATQFFRCFRDPELQPSAQLAVAEAKQTAAATVFGLTTYMFAIV